MKTARRTQEHAWLEQLLGDWTMDPVGDNAQGEPTPELGWRETVRSMGDLWILAEGRGQMPGGGPAHTMIMLGFDTRRNRFVGTWAGSMMTHLWVYEGTLDDSGAVLTLDCEGPDFANDGAMRRYQDIITILGPDHRRLTARIQGSDGEWQQIMTADYRRQR